MQQVPASTALTGQLVFKDANGAQVPGPAGSITASVPGVTASLSADGQSYNFTSPASGGVTLTWHDPAGKIPDFSADFSDQPGAAVSGAFGPAAPGTTP